MARDHIVRWNKDANGDTRRPSIDQVMKVATQFFGPVVKEWALERQTIFLTLVGLYTEPLKDIEGVHCFHDPADDSRERWIELFVQDDYLNVCTRHMDTFTNACAAELARVFARGWGGKAEIE